MASRNTGEYISLAADENRLVCGKLMSRQILTRFDRDKKNCWPVLRRNIGQYAGFFRICREIVLTCHVTSTPICKKIEL